MKKFKRVSSALAAVAMAACMAVGTGLSASAAAVYDANENIVGEGGFYAYWDSDDNGTSEWAAAPYSMYDANIAYATYNGNGTVTLTLQEGTFTTPRGEVKGSITGLYEVGSKDNLIEGNVVTLTVGAEYEYAVDGYHSGSVLKFVLV